MRTATVFWCITTRNLEAPADPLSPLGYKRHCRMDGQRPRVAVVDDEVSVLKALERLLRASGFDVNTFTSTHEFFSSREAWHPDCIVLDLYMPGINGAGVERWIEQIGGRVPVVVITGHDEPKTKAQSLAAGATDYICKPFNDDELLTAIQRALALRATPDTCSGAVDQEQARF